MKDDVKIYEAAKLSSVVAVECVYVPEEKNIHKKENVTGITNRMWPFHGKQKCIDLDSTVDSTTSSLTMTVSSKVKTNKFEDILQYSFEADDLPSVIFSDDDIDSGNDFIDDMTIGTAALVGNNTNRIRPDIIFTHADNDDSTNWLYERRGDFIIEPLHNQNIGSNLFENKTCNSFQNLSCFDDMNIFFENSIPMVCCSLRNSANIPDDNHDLKLEIDYDKDLL